MSLCNESEVEHLSQVLPVELLLLFSLSKVSFFRTLTCPSVSSTYTNRMKPVIVYAHFRVEFCGGISPFERNCRASIPTRYFFSDGSANRRRKGSKTLLLKSENYRNEWHNMWIKIQAIFIPLVASESFLCRFPVAETGSLCPSSRISRRQVAILTTRSQHSTDAPLRLFDSPPFYHQFNIYKNNEYITIVDWKVQIY